MERIAIPTLDGKLCAHFGHCAVFTLIDTEGGRIVRKEEIVPPPHEPGVLPAWLKEKGANIIIAGGMGARAQELFTQNGIKVVTGAVQDMPEKLVCDYFEGTLKVGQNLCDH
jgi:predicted Fe-Mo cluster-binding NifX family protein